LRAVLLAPACDEVEAVAVNASVPVTRDALRTPRAAAISGIVFSVLLTASDVLIRLAIPSTTTPDAAWLSEAALRTSVIVALNLVPFAGIAFLWFIGVVRDRMGQREDRFFATVFLGSGLLFVAMLFAASAMAAGLIATASAQSAPFVASDAWEIARTVSYTLLITYSMRMAAVFTIATATIAVRLTILPRWLVFLGYGCALVLLVGVGFVAWIELLFPAWVLASSVHLLVNTLRTPRMRASQGAAMG
jgi:hypothetical protein